MNTYQHWQIEKDGSSIIWAGFDRKGRSTNSIDDVVLDELKAIIESVAVDLDAKALVIYSVKEKGFIAGADITHFSDFKSVESVVNFLRKGQAVFDALELLQVTTVAMIDGFCMGGGTELALACDYRVVSEDSRIGLPEILLGIHPGWGGSVRLPRLIGAFSAITKVILTGSAQRAKKALKLGMVDAVVPHRQLRRATEYFIEKKPAKHSPSRWNKLLEIKFIRSLVAKIIRANVKKRVKEVHYPAPFAVIDNWEREGAYSDQAQVAEAHSFAGLIGQNGTAINLIRAFSLRDRMKAFSKQSDFKARHVHVVGAGIMGGDIAAWCALKGLTVTLEDRNNECIAPAVKRAYKLYKKRLRKPRLIQAAMDRLIPDVGGQGVAKADVIIEAIYENLEAKQALFKKIEVVAAPHAILATNTSSIPLDEINQSMENPDRLIGIHFFNPVAKMELVEVVCGENSDKEVLKNAYSFVGQIGRLSLPVKSSPGFLVNRVLMPYLMECVALLEEGVQAELIDLAAKNFGMFMGPVELADTVGLDVCLAVATNLTAHYGGEVPEKLKDKVSRGELGRKSSKGLYSYNKKLKPVKKKLVSNDWEKIANRLILRMVNESAACLREGVVESADLLDGALIFGAGFAPFRGGPMQYAHTFGEGKLNLLFKQLESEYGSRFKVDDGL